MNVQDLFFFTVVAVFTCDSAPRVKSKAQSNTFNNLQRVRPKHLNTLWSSATQYNSSVLVCAGEIWP